MKKKAQNFLMSAFMAASIFVASTNDAQAQNYKTNDKIKTRLDGLYDENGKAFDPASVAGKYTLIFFGTEYDTPSCASLFGEQKLVLDNLTDHCDGDEIVPIFICPYVKGDGQNDTSKRRAKSSNFMVLQADLEVVKDLAAKYYAGYFSYNKDGDPEKHSAFIYLQNEQGENILFYDAKREFGARALPEVDRALKADGYECN